MRSEALIRVLLPHYAASAARARHSAESRPKNRRSLSNAISELCLRAPLAKLLADIAWQRKKRGCAGAHAISARDSRPLRRGRGKQTDDARFFDRDVEFWHEVLRGQSGHRDADAVQISGGGCAVGSDRTIVRIRIVGEQNPMAWVFEEWLPTNAVTSDRFLKTSTAW